eukprot:GHVR01069099.1.p1 GENE.GHVR01069099.1~~GHVR01069099.1.p1  ORF type:complete len:144 (+),score=29.67 GHVR01069099.1:109-540(+)
MICGSGASSMHLSALLPCGTRVDMERDTDTLYDLRIVTGSEVHVDDSDVHSLSALGAFTDTSKVDKYEIAEEDYAKRNDTIRDHIMKLKQTNPEKFPVKGSEIFIYINIIFIYILYIFIYYICVNRNIYYYINIYNNIFLSNI